MFVGVQTVASVTHSAIRSWIISILKDRFFSGHAFNLVKNLRTARAMAENIKILDANVYEISPQDVSRGVAACERFHNGYLWLAFSCFCDGRKLYKLRPKRLTCKQKEWDL